MYSLSLSCHLDVRASLHMKYELSFNINSIVTSLAMQKLLFFPTLACQLLGHAGIHLMITSLVSISSTRIYTTGSCSELPIINEVGNKQYLNYDAFHSKPTNTIKKLMSVDDGSDDQKLSFLWEMLKFVIS